MIKYVEKNFKNYKPYVILSIIFSIFIILTCTYYREYIYLFTQPAKLKNVITYYGKYGILVFIGIQVLQVVVFFIPGEIIQIAGGYIYGSFLGSIVSIIGIIIGNIIAYSVSRCCGKPFVNKIISSKNLIFFQKILDLGSINSIVFILYLIPGIPKDILAYVCGISDIKFKNFLICSLLGRLPAVVLSAYFGAKIYSGNKIIIISIILITTFLFVLGAFRGEKMLVKFFKNKISQSNEQL